MSRPTPGHPAGSVGGEAFADYHEGKWGGLREWIADDLDRLALALWNVAHNLRPPHDGPVCPDCRIGPDVGENCPRS
jgi:hypothetical protein